MCFFLSQIVVENGRSKGFGFVTYSTPGTSKSSLSFLAFSRTRVSHPHHNSYYTMMLRQRMLRKPSKGAIIKSLTAGQFVWTRTFRKSVVKEPHLHLVAIRSATGLAIRRLPHLLEAMIEGIMTTAPHDLVVGRNWRQPCLMYAFGLVLDVSLSFLC